MGIFMYETTVFLFGFLSIFITDSCILTKFINCPILTLEAL